MLNSIIKGNFRLVAIAISVLSIIGWLLSGISIKHPSIIYLCWFIWVVSFVIGLQLYRIRKKFSARYDRFVIYLGLGMPIFFAIGVTLIYADIKTVDNSYCKQRMLMIAQAIEDYCAKNNGSFPEVSRWCDSLVSESKEWPRIGKKTFQCPDVQEGLSGYAINKKLEGKKLNEITPNTVILFEAVPGWNQNGGQELIRFNKHSFPPASKKLNIVYIGQDGLKYIKICIGDVNNFKWNP